MPLMKGRTKEIIGENIAELRRTGRPEKQAIAIAMHTAGKGKPRKPRKKKASY